MNKKAICFKTIETHTLGEPTRIIIEGFPKYAAKSMMEYKEYLENNYDQYRSALMCEPRGHKDMVGALLVEPISKEADIGVIYMDANRWINMCGHATIGVSMTLINENLVKVIEPVTHLTLETPAGLIQVDVEVENGKTKSVSFENIPSFLYKKDCEVNHIHFDISYSGSFFALIDADQLDIEINISNANKFKELGVKLLRQINEKYCVKHPILPINRVVNAEFYQKINGGQRNIVISEEGYSNIFLFGIGGTLLYAGQIMHTAKQLGCNLPLYLENATDFLYEGNAKFDKDSIVVIASLSGNTIEIEKAIDKAHEVGAKVMGYVEVLDSPLAKKVDYLVNTVGGEYYWWYSVVLRFMKNAGQFEKYDQLMEEIKNMPENVVQIYKDADEEMRAYAEKYCDEPITYLVASGNLEDWAVCYGMCIMEEMQWMRTRPISAANFFHGTLEVIERDIPVILIKGEDATRPEMDRVENFVHRVSAKVTVFDTKNYKLKGISDEFRGILSPIMMRSAFMRLNVHLEHCRRHPIDIRRYYKALDY